MIEYEPISFLFDEESVTLKTEEEGTVGVVG